MKTTAYSIIFLLLSIENSFAQKIEKIPIKYSLKDSIRVYVDYEIPRRHKQSIFTLVLINPSKETIYHFNFQKWHEKLWDGESWEEVGNGWFWCSTGSSEVSIPPKYCLMYEVYEYKEGQNVMMGIDYYYKSKQLLKNKDLNNIDYYIKNYSDKKITSWSKPFSISQKKQ